MTEERPLNATALHTGLSRVRSRRLALWASILIYVPGLFITLQLNATASTMTKLFGAWLGLLCVTVGWATVAKCPRCGNNFHTNGPTFFPVRKCVHCGLHVTADKNGKRVARDKSR